MEKKTVIIPGFRINGKSHIIGDSIGTISPPFPTNYKEAILGFKKIKVITIRNLFLSKGAL